MREADMLAWAGSADLDLVGAKSGDNDRDDTAGRGAGLRRRFDALGISDREWQARTGIDRKTLKRALADEPGTRASTYDAIEANLGKLEQWTEQTTPIGDPEDELVTFRVKGDFGVEVVVQGPIKDRPGLEASVARLVREMRSEREDAPNV